MIFGFGKKKETTEATAAQKSRADAAAEKVKSPADESADDLTELAEVDDAAKDAETQGNTEPDPDDPYGSADEDEDDEDAVDSDEDEDGEDDDDAEYDDEDEDDDDEDDDPEYEDEDDDDEDDEDDDDDEEEDEENEDEENEDDDTTETGSDAEVDEWDELDEQEWRDEGPYDLSELEPEEGESLGLDLGSLILDPVPGMEVQLQISEETQQIMSAVIVVGDSALELAAFAAPRTPGFWSELRAEVAAAAEAAGGSVGLVSGPFGTELRRLLPMKTPDGQVGQQPSRMWAVQGPRWLLRGVVYGQAAISEEDDNAEVAALISAYRGVIVRRGSTPRPPGEVLPLTPPQGLAEAAEAATKSE